MSTNSTVAVKTDTGYESIYVHWDGYFDYMYPMLSENYASWERAQALVSFGDASFIAKRIMPSTGSDHSFAHPEEDVCVFYHRDRDEPWEHNKPKAKATKEEVLKTQYYVYIFEDDRWRAYQGGVEVDSYEY
jgi:hypothetical protein